MGIASLVLGIVSAIIGFIPFCGIIAIIPAIVGLVLGIIELVKKNKEQQPKGVAIAGTTLSAIAIIIITVWFFVFSAGVTAGINDALRDVNSSYYDSSLYY